jgi:hypothetical protein
MREEVTRRDLSLTLGEHPVLKTHGCLALRPRRRGGRRWRVPFDPEFVVVPALRIDRFILYGAPPRENFDLTDGQFCPRTLILAERGIHAAFYADD